MNKRITTLLCIALVLFSGTSNLFAAGPHSCNMEMQKSENHCPMTMEKMDCCPVEQQDNSCKCPEMNSNNDLPAETSPVVIPVTFKNPGKFISLYYDVLNPANETQKVSTIVEISHNPLNNNKIYKSIQSFLI